MYVLGGGEYPGCFIHFRPCPPGNRETPHVFPVSPGGPNFVSQAYLCTCCLTACSRCTGSYKVQKLDIDNVQASWHSVYDVGVLAFLFVLACEILWRCQMYSKIMIYKRICDMCIYWIILIYVKDDHFCPTLFSKQSPLFAWLFEPLGRVWSRARWVNSRVLPANSLIQKATTAPWTELVALERFGMQYAKVRFTL